MWIHQSFSKVSFVNIQKSDAKASRVGKCREGAFAPLFSSQRSWYLQPFKEFICVLLSKVSSDELIVVLSVVKHKLANQ